VHHDRLVDVTALQPREDVSEFNVATKPRAVWFSTHDEALMLYFKRRRALAQEPEPAEDLIRRVWPQAATNASDREMLLALLRVRDEGFVAVTLTAADNARATGQVDEASALELYADKLNKLLGPRTSRMSYLLTFDRGAQPPDMRSLEARILLRLAQPDARTRDVLYHALAMDLMVDVDKVKAACEALTARGLLLQSGEHGARFSLAKIGARPFLVVLMDEQSVGGVVSFDEAGEAEAFLEKAGKGWPDSCVVLVVKGAKA